MRPAFQAKALLVLPKDISDYAADAFEPVPTHWQHILGLPDHIKVHWVDSFQKELRTLFKMNTFTRDFEMKEDGSIIPVTLKFQTKLTSTGSIDKLKMRSCLRGDLQLGSVPYTCS
jgi:hypothetical protein